VSDWLCVTSEQLWSFKLVKDASNQLCDRLDYHSVLKDGVHDQSEQDVNDFLKKKLSYPPTRYQRVQDKNWSHMVIFLYWTHHKPCNISEEGYWIRRWSRYYVEDDVAQLDSNRGAWSVIANQPVALSRTEVHHDWWHVHRLVTIPWFFLDRGFTKDKRSIK
jgi:hypothetical protein